MASRTNNVTLRGQNTINAKEAEVYITIDGQKYNAFHVKDLEITIENKTSDVPVLRKTLTQHKLASQTGKYKGTKYTVSSELRMAYARYKETGAVPEMTIQIDNYDPNSGLGRQSVIIKDCIDSSFTLAKADSDDGTLTEDMEGTFDDYEVPQGFDPIPGLAM